MAISLFDSIRCVICGLDQAGRRGLLEAMPPMRPQQTAREQARPSLERPSVYAKQKRLQKLCAGQACCQADNRADGYHEEHSGCNASDHMGGRGTQCHANADLPSVLNYRKVEHSVQANGRQ
jgi:hypothetical protein